VHPRVRSPAAHRSHRVAADLAQCLIHGLGHGVGLEIHERPNLNFRGTTPLKGGEIITVEPGLYYPEWGGIRMEDMVHIVPDGARRLTRITDDFVIE